MIHDDEHFLALTDAFSSAAFDDAGWHPALEAFAQATGSVSGQLIGVGTDATAPLNIMTNIDPSFLREFDALGGADPTVNPRVSTGFAAPILQPATEADFVVSEQQRRSPRYQEFEHFVRRWDVPNICLTTLERRENQLVGLAVVRSARQGPIGAAQRKAFSAIAPHVRAAVRTRQSLGGEHAKLIAGTLESLAITAFVCDHDGRVMALTPGAEDLVRAGRGLQLSRGQLQPAIAADARALRDAVDAIVKPGAGARCIPQPVLIRGAGGGRPLVLDVIALPTQRFDFSFTPRLMIVARTGTGCPARQAIVLRVAYGLTAAETDIAGQLGQASTAEVIAAQRGVAVGTVRVQIKTILAKLGVKRQVELVATLAQL